MKKVFWLCFLVLFVIGSVQAHSKPDIAARITAYQTIVVSDGDTLWKLAAQSASSQDDIRDIILAIRVANDLNANGEIFPGQELKVPAFR